MLTLFASNRKGQCQKQLELVLQLEKTGREHADCSFALLSQEAGNDQGSLPNTMVRINAAATGGNINSISVAVN